MVNKAHITLNEVESDLGKISSRNAHLFMTGKRISDSAKNYILNKVGESLTGVTSDRMFGFTEQYDWQISIEPEAVDKYVEVNNPEFVFKFPTVSSGSVFISEPSAIIIIGINQNNENEYIVEPILCKCPREFSQFIKYTECKTPENLKAFSPKHYWRVLADMLCCNAIKAHFFVFHPLFEEGTNYHTIIFDRLPLIADINFLRSRQAEASRIYTEQIENLKSKQ